MVNGIKNVSQILQHVVGAELIYIAGVCNGLVEGWALALIHAIG